MGKKKIIFLLEAISKPLLAVMLNLIQHLERFRNKFGMTVLIQVLEVLLIIVLCGIFGGPYGGIFRGEINGIDEGQFASWAYQMLHSKKLFSEIYPTYGPLYIYPLYALFSLFMPSLFLLRLYLVIGAVSCILVSLYILYLLRVRFILRLLAIILLAILPIATLRQAVGLLAIVLYGMYTKNETKKLGILTGILSAVTFFVSPEIGLYVLCIVLGHYVYSLVVVKQTGVILRRYIVQFTGFTLTVFLFAIWAYSASWLTDYISVTTDLFQSFSGINTPNGQNFPTIQSILGSVSSVPAFIKAVLSKEALLYWEIASYTGIFISSIIRFVSGNFTNKDRLVLFITLFGISLYTILLSRHGVGHFYFTLPPLIILFMYITEQLITKIKGNFSQNALISCILLMFISFFIFRLLMIHRFEITLELNHILGNSSKYVYMSNDAFGVLGSRFSSFSMGQMITERYTKENDYVFILSDQPIFYLVSKRLNPTRYDLPYIANSAQKRFEIISDLKKNKARLILYDTSVWEVDGISNKKRLPEVYQYIQDAYTYEGMEGTFEVYLLRE